MRLWCQRKRSPSFLGQSSTSATKRESGRFRFECPRQAFKRKLGSIQTPTCIFTQRPRPGEKAWCARPSPGHTCPFESSDLPFLTRKDELHIRNLAWILASHSASWKAGVTAGMFRVSCWEWAVENFGQALVVEYLQSHADRLDGVMFRIQEDFAHYGIPARLLELLSPSSLPSHLHAELHFAMYKYEKRHHALECHFHYRRQWCG